MERAVERALARSSAPISEVRTAVRGVCRRRCRLRYESSLRLASSLPLSYPPALPPSPPPSPLQRSQWRQWRRGRAGSVAENLSQWRQRRRQDCARELGERPGGRGSQAAAAAEGCCLKPTGDAAPLVVPRGVGSLSEGEGEGEQYKISFAHHTHVVVYPRSSCYTRSLAQTVLLRRWTRARSPSQLSLTSEDDSGGGGRSGEPPGASDGRTKPTYVRKRSVSVSANVRSVRRGAPLVQRSARTLTYSIARNQQSSDGSARE